MDSYFSIIVPAHNESRIIDRTLTLLAELDYPKDRYEVTVVENGSTDDTFALGQAHMPSTPNLHVYHAKKKGVSHARNFGLEKSSPDADWYIFMDCDVFLEKGFLRQLNGYLAKRPSIGYGTTTVNLDNNTFLGAFWSCVNNFFYRMFKVLFTIHVIRKDFVHQVSYDENLVSGEDIQYGRDLSAKGAKYFFMPTNKVRCSDRRFQKNGYIGMFLINLYHGITMFILPEGILKKINWEVIR